MALPFAHPASLVATVFGIGRAPVAAGTVASLAALPVAWALLNLPGPYGRALLFAAATAALGFGLWAAHQYAAAKGAADPKEVVIDEVAGQWYALVFADGAVWWHFALGFALFRAFDIVKPWPVNWAQDHLPGGWGIMLDDIVAAIYAAALSYAAIWLSEREFVVRLFAAL
jgi:phosphatidylglycerophosphatase A